jgi:hypothetical protein
LAGVVGGGDGGKVGVQEGSAELGSGFGRWLRAKVKSEWRGPAACDALGCPTLGLGLRRRRLFWTIQSWSSLARWVEGAAEADLSGWTELLKESAEVALCDGVLDGSAPGDGDVREFRARGAVRGRCVSNEGLPEPLRLSRTWKPYRNDRACGVWGIALGALYGRVNCLLNMQCRGVGVVVKA